RAVPRTTQLRVAAPGRRDPAGAAGRRAGAGGHRRARPAAVAGAAGDGRRGRCLRAALAVAGAGATGAERGGAQALTPARSLEPGHGCPGSIDGAEGVHGLVTAGQPSSSTRHATVPVATTTAPAATQAQSTGRRQQVTSPTTQISSPAPQPASATTGARRSAWYGMSVAGSTWLPSTAPIASSTAQTAVAPIIGKSNERAKIADSGELGPGAGGGMGWLGSG